MHLTATLPDGQEVASVPQQFEVLPWDGALPTGAGHAVIDIGHPGWDQASRQAHQTDPRSGQRALGWWSRSSATVALPADLSGGYSLSLLGRGDWYDGPPLIRVTLATPDGDATLGEFPLPRDWSRQSVQQINLPGGEQRLTLKFFNDKHNPETGEDRNAWLGGVALTATEPDIHDAAPTATLLYPEPGAQWHGTDAVVAQLNDDRGIAHAELLCDGKPTGFLFAPEPGEALAVLAFPVGRLEPGTRAIAVRVTDQSGQQHDSQPVTVRITDRSPDKPGRYARAVALLNRFAFGPDPHELAAVLTLGERAYLEQRLQAEPDAGVLNAWAWARQHYPRDDNRYHVRHRAIAHLLATPNPVRARLRMVIDNHFNTWIAKTEADRKNDEHMRWARLGPADFQSLLLASATSPAMLRYLDQQESYVGHLNENYAREVMELHTLGVDRGYTQADVTALAHVLTGWTAAEQASLSRTGGAMTSAFLFAPELATGPGQRVAGLVLPDARGAEQAARIETVLAMLTRHPNTAEYVSRKLAEHLAVNPAPDPLVQRLARVFQESGGDLAAVTRALAAGDWLNAVARTPDRFTMPLAFAVRLARQADSHDAQRVVRFLDRSGFGVFDWQTPDGAPADDPSYANTNAMLQRWTYAHHVGPGLYQALAPPMRKAPDAQAPGAMAAWTDTLTDLMAIRLTGRPLGDRSRQAVRSTLRDRGGVPSRQAYELAVLIAQMPEAQMR